MANEFPTAGPFVGAYVGGLCASATFAGIALLAWGRDAEGWTFVGSSTVLFLGALTLFSRLEGGVNFNHSNRQWSTILPFALPVAMGCAVATAAGGLLLLGLRELTLGSLTSASGVAGALAGTARLAWRDRRSR